MQSYNRVNYHSVGNELAEDLNLLSPSPWRYDIVLEAVYHKCFQTKRFKKQIRRKKKIRGGGQNLKDHWPLAIYVSYRLKNHILVTTKTRKGVTLYEVKHQNNIDVILVLSCLSLNFYLFSISFATLFCNFVISFILFLTTY